MATSARDDINQKAEATRAKADALWQKLAKTAPSEGVRRQTIAEWQRHVARRIEQGVE
jgi:hypothetical protein